MTKPVNEGVTTEQARELLAYDPLTGTFCWKVSHPGYCAGRPAGYLAKGYLRITIGGRGIRAHRLAWLIVHGKFPDGLLDHIDGNTLNNSIANLREVNARQSAQNIKRQGYAYLRTRRHPNKYLSSIVVDGERKHLGYYATAEEARAAYRSATVKYFGEYSRHFREGAAHD
jgi:hypothetical protein